MSSKEVNETTGTAVKTATTATSQNFPVKVKRTLLVGSWQLQSLWPEVLDFLKVESQRRRDGSSSSSSKESDVVDNDDTDADNIVEALNLSIVSVGDEESNKAAIESAFLATVEAACAEGRVSRVSWDGATMVNAHNVMRLPSLFVSRETYLEGQPSDVVSSETELTFLGTTFAPAMDQQALDELFEVSVSHYNDFNIFESLAGFYKLVCATGERDTRSLFNIACAFHVIDLYSLAVYYLKTLLEIRQDTLSHQVLWAIAQSGRFDAMIIDVYSNLATNHGDVFAKQKLALMTGTGAESIKSDPKYIEIVYDNLADAFENRLVNVLGYDAPWSMYKLICQVVQENGGCIKEEVDQEKDESTITATVAAGGARAGVAAADSKCWRVLDLGCGTGLIGKVFKSFIKSSYKTSSEGAVVANRDANYYSRTTYTDLPLFTNWYEENALGAKPEDSSYLIGVDVSKNMISHAQKTQTYDSFYIGDLNEFLPTLLAVHKKYKEISASSALANSKDFNLVIAADTFIYIGILGKVFSFISRVMDRGGLFSFTTEDLDSSPMNNVESSSSSSEDFKLDSEYEPNDIVWGKMVDSGRFAHSNGYILQLAKNYQFEVVVHESIILRKEGGVPLGGNIFVLRKL